VSESDGASALEYVVSVLESRRLADAGDQSAPERLLVVEMASERQRWLMLAVVVTAVGLERIPQAAARGVPPHAAAGVGGSPDMDDVETVAGIVSDGQQPEEQGGAHEEQSMGLWATVGGALMSGLAELLEVGGHGSLDGGNQSGGASSVEHRLSRVSADERSRQDSAAPDASGQPPSSPAGGMDAPLPEWSGWYELGDRMRTAMGPSHAQMLAERALDDDNSEVETRREAERRGKSQGQEEEVNRTHDGRFWGSVPLIGRANATRMVHRVVEDERVRRRQSTASSEHPAASGHRRSTRDVSVDAEGNMVRDEDEEDEEAEEEAEEEGAGGEEAEHGFLSEADLDRIIERERERTPVHYHRSFRAGFASR